MGDFTVSNPNEQVPDSGAGNPTPPAAAPFHDTSDFPPAPVEQELVPPVNDDGGLPEKYRGKSVAEIVEMHRHAESELGRTRNEVGTLRRLADELIGVRRAELAQPATPTKPVREKLTTDALLGDPEAAITSVIAAEAEARDASLRQRTDRLEAELALTHFEKKHPDYKTTMETPAFADWVQTTPYRARLAQAAIQGDFTAADELFSLYGERTAAASPANPGVNPTAQARNAGLVRSGGSAAAGVVQGGAGKKVWSRAELIQMRIHEPEKFDSMYATEIEPAYREKRVR